MEIILENISKKFVNDWIFRGVNHHFSQGKPAAILGRNGSGKSTLLQIISGNLHPTKGTIRYQLDGKEIDVQNIYEQLVIVAPYLELVEDFTLDEMLRFHFGFKKILPGFTPEKAKEMLGFTVSGKKPIRQYSSGMKQRVKLVLAFLSDVPLILLDEPTMNLDKNGIAWYQQLVSDHTAGRMVIVCTNQPEQEAPFSTETVRIEDYKS
jgi:ABC-type multidrug transport system ATPase subunit